LAGSNKAMMATVKESVTGQKKKEAVEIGSADAW